MTFPYMEEWFPMWLKHPNSNQQWRFVLVAPNKEEVLITGKNLHNLVDKVLIQIGQWDADGYEYSKGPRKEAESLKVDWYNYIMRCVEHQMCQRLPATECYRGRGDDLHEFFSGVDTFIDGLSKPLQRIGRSLTKAATFVATGKAQARMGSCRTCGGGRKFQNDRHNLGRAGKLN